MSLLCASVFLYVIHVLVYHLESKMIGGDPRIYMVMLRVKTYGYDSSRTTLRSLRRTKMFAKKLSKIAPLTDPIDRPSMH